MECSRRENATRWLHKDRDGTSIKRKYQSLYNAKPPTGDLNCPKHTRRAKLIQRKIMGKINASDGEFGKSKDLSSDVRDDGDLEEEEEVSDCDHKNDIMESVDKEELPISKKVAYVPFRPPKRLENPITLPVPVYAQTAKGSKSGKVTRRNTSKAAERQPLQGIIF